MNPKRHPLATRQLQFHLPQRLLRQVDRATPDCASRARLVVDPAMQAMRDTWSAGRFGIGYAAHVSPCKVAMNSSREHGDADFFLEAYGQRFAFQTAAKHMPGRLLGPIYGQGRRCTKGVAHEDPELDAAAGPGWIAKAVADKAAKHYSNPGNLQLLIYANFWAALVKQVAIADATARWRDTFGSLWVITGAHITSIWSPLELGSIGGWGKLPAY